MKSLLPLIVYGAIVFCFGIVLTVLTWPYALAPAEVNKQYPVACEIILIFVSIGQLISIIVTVLFNKCTLTGHDHLIILAIIIYLIMLFPCGAGQLIVVVLMIINAETNSDGGVGGIIAALTVIYMLASSVYHIIVFIWFYRKVKQCENENDY